MRASNARFAGGFSGVLFAIVGGFAAGFAENANAQTAMQVYEPVGTVTLYNIHPVNTDPLTINASQPLAAVIQEIVDEGGIGANNYFRGGSTGNVLATVTDGMIVGATKGDIIRLVDDAVFGQMILGQLTVRLYEREGELYMAGGEFPATMSVAVTRPQFFLNTTTWEIIPTAEECGAMMPPQVLDSDTSMCRLPNSDGECAGLDSATPIYDEGDGMCRATEAADCTAENALFFEGGVCVAQCSEGMEAGSDGITCEEATTTDPTDMTCPDGQERVDGVCPDPGSPAPTPTATLSATLDGGGGDDETKDLRNILGGVGVVMFFATWAFSDDLDNYAFSPSFGYAVNESGYSANAGGRLDFRKGDWSAYWSAGQTNANGAFGEFRYSSGGEYKADFWQASFSESVQGKTADYDLSLSADLQDGIWSLSPVYRIHSRLEEGETATKNTLNLEGVLEWNRWTIRQSAGFGWRRMENFGDSAKFRLEAVREF